MKSAATDANLDTRHKTLTNHAVRKSNVGRLKEEAVPDTTIVQLTGHKRAESLSSYYQASINHEHSMSKILSGQPSEVQWSGGSSHSTVTSANQEVPTNAVAANLSKPKNGTRSPLSSLTSRVANANHQSVPPPSQLESLFAGSRIGSTSNCTIQVFQDHPQSMVPSGIWPIHPKFQAHNQSIVGNSPKPVK